MCSFSTTPTTWICTLCMHLFYFFLLLVDTLAPGRVGSLISGLHLLWMHTGTGNEPPSSDPAGLQVPMQDPLPLQGPMQDPPPPLQDPTSVMDLVLRYSGVLV